MIHDDRLSLPVWGLLVFFFQMNGAMDGGLGWDGVERSALM